MTDKKALANRKDLMEREILEQEKPEQERPKAL